MQYCLIQLCRKWKKMEPAGMKNSAKDTKRRVRKLTGV